MKYIRPTAGRFLPILVLLISAPLRGDTPTIISEWNVGIQFLDTLNFTSWPGIDTAVPVDVSAEAGRVWLLWPRTLVSLDAEGSPDAETLLALFASSGSAGGNSWSPEGGLVCSDGTWRSVDPEGGTILAMDPRTGETVSHPGDIPPGALLLPAPGGNLAVLAGTEALLLETGEQGPGPCESTVMDSGFPPVTLAAFSRREAIGAWRIAGSDSIEISPVPRTEAGGMKIPVPGNPRSMDWAGPLLVLAEGGKLTFVDPRGGEPEFMVLEDERLPDRWYRVRGGDDRLIVHSPESGTVALIIPGASETPPAAADRDFGRLLENHVLEAGDFIEKQASTDRAAAFYGWALPLVRQMRSRYPLAETWPGLEKEIADRRARLRGIW